MKMEGCVCIEYCSYNYLHLFSSFQNRNGIDHRWLMILSQMVILNNSYDQKLNSPSYTNEGSVGILDDDSPIEWFSTVDRSHIRGNRRKKSTFDAPLNTTYAMNEHEEYYVHIYDFVDDRSGYCERWLKIVYQTNVSHDHLFLILGRAQRGCTVWKNNKQWQIVWTIPINNNFTCHANLNMLTKGSSC